MVAAETPNCVSCAQNRKAIEDFYGPDAKVDGGDWVVDILRHQGRPRWRLAASRSPSRTARRPSTGRADGNDQKLKPGQLRVKLKLVWKDGSWKVAENTRIA